MRRELTAGVIAAVALAAATVVLGMLGQWRLAVAVLGVVLGLLVLAVFVGHRRMRDLQQEVAHLRESSRQLIAAQERVLLGLQKQRREAARRHRSLLGAVEQGRKSSSASLKKVESHLTKRQGEQTQEHEALIQLYRHIEPRAPMPPSGQWALNPSELLELWHVLASRRPKLVLELGGGTSSVWIAYALERHRGRLISVDHDADFVAHTNSQLRRHGLTAVAEVRHAPLRQLTLDGETFQWYDPEVLADLAEVELLLVDGPPGRTGPRARQPGLSVLQDRLSAQAIVILDDADRADEQEILREWLESVPGLRRESVTVGHAAVFSYSRPAPGATAPSDRGDGG